MTLADIRALAVSHTLFPEMTLGRAVSRLGFVQADPIRTPATAQDLVLRHRVRDYRAGDLERSYARLAIEEDYLYAYGFVSRATSHALHPRPAKPMTAVEKRVLAMVRAQGAAARAKDLEGADDAQPVALLDARRRLRVDASEHPVEAEVAPAIGDSLQPPAEVGIARWAREQTPA